MCCICFNEKMKNHNPTTKIDHELEIGRALTWYNWQSRTADNRIFVMHGLKLKNPRPRYVGMFWYRR